MEHANSLVRILSQHEYMDTCVYFLCAPRLTAVSPESQLRCSTPITLGSDKPKRNRSLEPLSRISGGRRHCRFASTAASGNSSDHDEQLYSDYISCRFSSSFCIFTFSGFFSTRDIDQGLLGRNNHCYEARPPVRRFSANTHSTYVPFSLDICYTLRPHKKDIHYRSRVVLNIATDNNQYPSAETISQNLLSIGNLAVSTEDFNSSACMEEYV